MSYVIKFAAKITRADMLEEACNRMRKAGLAVIGPVKIGTEREVQLPGWYRRVRCQCDETGEVLADNDSSYVDNRKIDPKTGQRINGTGYVHPDVASGKERIGAHGVGGDIRHLERLTMEYHAAIVDQEVTKQGGRIVYSSVDEEKGVMLIRAEVPD